MNAAGDHGTGRAAPSWGSHASLACVVVDAAGADPASAGAFESTRLAAGGGDFTLRVAGQSFTPTPTVHRNDSPGRLDSSARMISKRRSPRMTACRPRWSPALTCVEPSWMRVGPAPQFVGVGGTPSEVRWNCQRRTTLFRSRTVLRATLSPTDLAAAGTANVTVFDPTPGSDSSAPLRFRIRGTGAPTRIR